MLNGKYENLEDKVLTVIADLKKILSEIPMDRLFDFYECYYGRLSRLSCYLNHNGFRCYLLGGRLLNAVRDGSVCLNVDDLPYAAVFGILNNESFSEVWEHVTKFVDRDDILKGDSKGKKYGDGYSPYWYSSNYTDEYSNYVNVSMHTLDTSNIMQFNFECDGFDEFPLQQVEFVRYVYNEDGNVYVNAYDPYHEIHNLDDVWLEKRSLVDLYGSVFTTLDREYINLYFERRYGVGWDVPVDHLSIFRKKFSEGGYHG